MKKHNKKQSRVFVCVFLASSSFCIVCFKIPKSKDEHEEHYQIKICLGTYYCFYPGFDLLFILHLDAGDVVTNLFFADFILISMI